MLAASVFIALLQQYSKFENGTLSIIYASDNLELIRKENNHKTYNNPKTPWGGTKKNILHAKNRKRVERNVTDIFPSNFVSFTQCFEICMLYLCLVRASHIVAFAFRTDGQFKLTNTSLQTN